VENTDRGVITDGEENVWNKEGGREGRLEEDCKMRSFITCTLHQILLG
jgi:hypothetical protein